MNNYVCICAGGTGGHINAALSLGEFFSGKGFEILYFTGTRYLDYQLFGDSLQVTHLNSKPLRSKNPFSLAKSAVLNLGVFFSVIGSYLRNRPDAVIGAGGYVCGPTLLAAKLLGIKTYIIEQNAVAGMTNKLLAKISNKTFLNFKDTKGIPASEKNVVAGNPVRANITYFEPDTDSPLNILVFGGSLGAKQINNAVKGMVGKDWDHPISVVHQVGKGNSEPYLIGKNVTYEQKEYLNNMGELYKWSNIIISRAGASTISELRIAKRPAILIPFPFATDNHQQHNAEQLANEGIFHVKVLDQSKSGEELESLLIDSIREIENKNLFFPSKDCANVNSCEIIYTEVMRDVRN